MTPLRRSPWTTLLKRLGGLVQRDTPAPSVDASDRVIKPWYDDASRTYPTVGMTPGRVLSYMQAADHGHPQLQFELFDEMLQKWPRLAAVEATRRLALTGLDWELQSPVDAAANENSAAVSTFCRETLANIDSLRDTLDHLATAIGYGIAVAELVWEDGRLVDLVPVPHSRLVTDPTQPWKLGVRTADSPTFGVPIDEQPLKWMVHRPRVRLGRHFDGGLLRASALLFLAQNLSFKDWLIFSQIAGMPVRVARFDPGTPEAEQRALLQMLAKLGTDAVAAFSKNIELDFVEAGRSGDRPYQPLQDYCNTEVTILWLGQHLTTDIRQSGSRAAADVHDRVREDLLVHDIADEGKTVRRDLLTPIVRARFGDQVPVPVFKRSLVQSVDTKSLADTLAVAVNELGMAVPKRWLHQSLGIPEPQGSEAVITREVAQ